MRGMEFCFVEGAHDVSLLSVSGFSGNGRGGNYGLPDLLDERVSRFGPPKAHAENVAFPASPRLWRVRFHGHQISGSNGAAVETGQIAGVSTSGRAHARACPKAIRRRWIRKRRGGAQRPEGFRQQGACLSGEELKFKRRGPHALGFSFFSYGLILRLDIFRV